MHAGDLHMCESKTKTGRAARPTQWKWNRSKIPDSACLPQRNNFHHNFLRETPIQKKRREDWRPGSPDVLHVKNDFPSTIVRKSGLAWETQTQREAISMMRYTAREEKDLQLYFQLSHTNPWFSHFTEIRTNQWFLGIVALKPGQVLISRFQLEPSMPQAYSQQSRIPLGSWILEECQPQLFSFSYRLDAPCEQQRSP